MTEEIEAKIRARLRYEPETGKLYLLEDAGRRGGKAGEEVVSRPNKAGYLRVRVCGQLFTQHRVAWFLMTGEWPEQIDHINHIRADNRFRNLRSTSNAGNRLNLSMSPRNKSGVNGVDWYARDQKWRVQVCINGENRWLGCFDTLEEAKAVRAAANEQLGFHENHGKKLEAA